MIPQTPKKPMMQIETEHGEKSRWIAAARKAGLDFAAWVRHQLNKAADESNK